MPHRVPLLALVCLTLLVALLGCGSADQVPASQPTIAAGSDSPSAVDLLVQAGYEISDDYVVESVVRDIDSGTGGLAVDGQGTIYQADFGYAGHPGDSVYRVSRDGTVETFSQSDRMGSLTMTTLGPKGTIYQSSYGTDRVFAIDKFGHSVVVARGIAGPSGLVVLPDGTLVVEAYDSGRIYRISPDGKRHEWVADERFNGINGLALGPDGVLYVADHRDGGLFAVERDGAVSELHRFPGATSHVAYLDGGLFVTSREGFVVYRYDLETGSVAVVAGNGEPGDRDGRGIEASFGRPNAITVGPDGTLFFNHGDGEGNSPVHIRSIRYAPTT